MATYHRKRGDVTRAKLRTNAVWRLDAMQMPTPSCLGLSPLA